MMKVFNIVSKQDLFNALGMNGNLNVLVNGRVGNLLSVEREDGSGTKFNVRISRYNHRTCEFITETLYMSFDKTGWPA